MRVSDAERQSVAESLRQALTEGRLDLDEYDERVQRAYQAKTYRELGAITVDLPDAKPPVPARVPPAPRRDPALRGGPNGVALLSLLGIFVGIAVVLSVVSGGVILPFWPLFIFGFWRLSHRHG
jgi:uncharacterized protein DUF1707